MRVVIADPPAYTPPYDYALAGALARQGVDVRLLTSRFRFGAVPEADGFTVDDSLYRVSSGLSSSRGRLAVKALEHPLALARLGLADCDLLHLQWVAAPEADGLLLHTRRPLVFTAHDLLPRRTASHTRTWKRLFGRFDRVVTHSERGREDARGVRRQPRQAPGHPPPRLPQRSGPARRRPHRARARRDPARTRASPTRSRPSGASRVRACSSPAIRASRSTSSGSRRAIGPSGGSATWARSEIADALGAATVAVFPYRAELDQSGALLQVIGAGIPAVVYDVGGLGEIVSCVRGGPRRRAR